MAVSVIEDFAISILADRFKTETVIGCGVFSDDISVYLRLPNTSTVLCNRISSKENIDIYTCR